MWNRFINSRISRKVLPVVMVLLFMLPVGVLYLTMQPLTDEPELPVHAANLEDVMPVKPATCPGSHDLQDCGTDNKVLIIFVRP